MSPNANVSRRKVRTEVEICEVNQEFIGIILRVV